MARLRAALRSKGPAFRPQTRYLNADGSPKYVNRLILASSPYLLEHADNPVNWFPWGEQAFERARRENKPVLLSIGYSTCHWCHLMARESFEDLEIARYINENYIPILVDREQRPDIDAVYLKVVEKLTGKGGWPMTVVLTPKKQPFFGSTYLPAHNGDHGAKEGFLSILHRLKHEYDAHRGEVVRRARRISRDIRAAAAPRPPGDVPKPGLIKQVVADAAAAFDPALGDFNGAPNYPRPELMELLLRYHRRTGDARALAIVTRTLEKMAAGGIYDQIGGGFHRYTVDAHWLVPHFEKMLYTNALLVSVYLDAYQVTGRPEFARVARETLGWVKRDMTAPGGAFYTATDADSRAPSGRNQEGYYFTWTPAQIDAALGHGEGRVARVYFGVTAAGNFHGRNVLSRPRSDREVAAALGLSIPALRRKLRDARARLRRARLGRPAPRRDDKIITAQTGLMISALSRAGLDLGDAAYIRRADRAADFVLAHLRGHDGRLRRLFKDGRASHRACLDDYAFFIQGLLDLFEATSNPARLDEAIALQRQLDRRFWDRNAGGYFFTSDDAERLLSREKPIHDGGVPPGNAIAAMNLVRMAEITTQGSYRKRAERDLAACAPAMKRSPDASLSMLSALDSYLDTALEVFVVRPTPAADAEPLLARFRAAYLPDRVFAVVAQGPELGALAGRVPGLEGKRALHGRVTAFVCQRGGCRLPTSDPAVFARQLAWAAPLFPGGHAGGRRRRQDP